MLTEDKTIGDSNVQQKPKNILVVLPTLHTNMVVSPHLITVVDSSHILVVEGDGLWALDY